MSSTKLLHNELKQFLPSRLHEFIPQNANTSIPFIKMKRLPQIDDSLLILTEFMSLNISFTSPLLQAIDFLQQFHKYSLRAVLSSFPIPNQAFDAFYNQIQNTIMLKYKKNVTRIMKMMYEMINVANCQKINEMKMYQEIFLQIKNQLLLTRKQTDPYGFNPSQFQNDKQEVKKILQFCQKHLNINNITQCQLEDKERMRKQNQNFRIEAKRQIEKLTQKIKIKTMVMMDKINDAKVQYPYRPQNQAYDMVESNKILNSFYSKIKIKNIQTYEDLQNKRYELQKDLRVIIESGLKQYKEDTSFYAKSLIDQYNKECKSSKNHKHYLATSISSSLLNFDKRRGVDANDINMTFTQVSQMKPAIKNIRKQLKFDNIVRLNDLDNKVEYIVDIESSNLPYGKVKNDRANEIISLDLQFDMKVDSLCFKKDQSKNLFQNNFYDLQYQKPQQCRTREFKDKNKLTFEQNMKKLQSEFIEYRKSKQENNRVYLSKESKLQFIKNIYIQKNFIIQCLFDNQQENAPKNNKLSHKESLQKQVLKNPFQKKKVSNMFAQQQNNKPISTEPHHQYLLFKTNSDKYRFFNDTSNLSQQQIQQIEAQNSAFQSQRKIDYQRKIEAIRGMFEMKTYEKFCALTINPKTKKGGLDHQNYIEGNKIYRYGIEIDLRWQSFTGHNKSYSQNQKLSKSSPQYHKVCKMAHTDLERLNKFFFYTFKERYYRQTKNVQENLQIPISMALENQNEFLNQKMVKKILNLMKKFDFFILWTLGDIIAYEEKVQFGLRKAKITIYVFAQNEKLGTGLIWEIRKRVDETFKQQNRQNPKGNDFSSKGSRKMIRYVLEERVQYPFYDKKSFSENKETINEILCKIECAHRVLYDRHKRPLRVEKTIEKGRQLWDELIKWK